MKLKQLSDLKTIHTLTHEAYLAACNALALFSGGDGGDSKLTQELEHLTAHFESSTVALRNLCEESSPSPSGAFGKPSAPTIRIAGRAEVTEYGWLHIELNALLPHCRFRPPAYLTDTIRRLLDELERRRPLPRFERAMMVIDEHCDLRSRQVFDNDNKGWKGISNVLKGRVIADDDQFSLAVSLLSTRSETPACHIVLLPFSDAGDFFTLKCGGYPGV